MSETKIFEARYPTRTAGFIFVLISLVLSLATVIFLLNVAVSDRPRSDPDYGQTNWVVLIVSVVGGLALFWVALKAIRKFLRNQPRRVILEAEQIVIQNETGATLANVPYSQVTALAEDRQLLANGQYEASYKQVRLTWYAGNEERHAVLSERDTTNFDELLDSLWERCPEAARGARTFER